MTDLTEITRAVKPVIIIADTIIDRNSQGMSELFFNDGSVATTAEITPEVTPANNISICSDKIIFLILFTLHPVASMSANSRFR